MKWAIFEQKLIFQPYRLKFLFYTAFMLTNCILSALLLNNSIQSAVTLVLKRLVFHPNCDLLSSKG